MGFPQSPEVALCLGLVCICLLVYWTHPLCCRQCALVWAHSLRGAGEGGTRCALVPSHWACPLSQGLCVLLDPPGLLSMLWGLCVTEFVCHASLGTLGPTLCTTGLLWACFSSWAQCLVGTHSLWAVYGLRSAAFSVLRPLSLCFVQPSEIVQIPPTMRLPPSSWQLPCFRNSLPPSLSTSSCQMFYAFFPFYISIFSPTSFQGA